MNTINSVNTQGFTSSPTPSPPHAALVGSLMRLCQVVQAYVNSAYEPSLRDLQQESGLRVKIKHHVSEAEGYQLCPQEVLLLPWGALSRWTGVQRPLGSMSASKSGIISSGALTQIDVISRALRDDEAARAATLIDELLAQTGALVRQEAEPSGELNDILRGSLNLDQEEDDLRPNDDRRVIHDPLAVYCSYPTSSQTDDTMSPQDLRRVIEGARPRVEYFALRLLWCAARMSQGLRPLTEVVQVHELSHLTTHVGLDASDQHWASFHYEPKEMIEGTAQELTHRLLERRVRESEQVRSSKSRARSQLNLDCFLRLLQGQAQPYQEHLNWRLQLPQSVQRQAFIIACRLTTDRKTLKQSLRGIF